MCVKYDGRVVLFVFSIIHHLLVFGGKNFHQKIVNIELEQYRLIKKIFGKSQ
tara:strand:- start:58 stop:213 length:156 start_codon:yes stop_codon:yes gene_type:complete